MLKPHSYYLSRTSMLNFLKELESTANIESSLYIPPATPSREVDFLVKKVCAEAAFLEQCLQFTRESGTGAVLFEGKSKLTLALLSFPITG